MRGWAEKVEMERMRASLVLKCTYFEDLLTHWVCNVREGKEVGQVLGY